MRVYRKITDLIGGTPLLELTNYEKANELNAKIYAKLEYFNPAGSVKDRIAKAMLDDAEEKGLLKPGAVIIEPTSGNTGIGLAALAAALGYKAVIVMPDSMSPERIKLIAAYGAEVGAGMPVRVGGEELSLVSVSSEAVQLGADAPEAGFDAGQYVYVSELSGSVGDGVYEAEIVVDSIAPLSFLWN